MNGSNVSSSPPTVRAESQRQGSTLYQQLLGRVFPREPVSASGAHPRDRVAAGELEPGDLVEVRPLPAIGRTVNEERRRRGLYFMPEMERFCGQRYRVMKPVRTIKLESSGEVRRIVDPTFLLEGVYCDGERHGGCDRACLHLWSEAWLQRVPAEEGSPESSTSSCGSSGLCISGRVLPGGLILACAC